MMKSIKVNTTGFLFLFFSLLTTEIFSQQIFATRRIDYTEQQLQGLFLGALATLSEDRIPLAYRSRVAGEPKLKCPTFLLLEVERNLDLFSPDQQSILKQMFVRPQLPLHYVKVPGQFKIHYATSGRDSVSSVDNDSNGIPDFVEEVYASLERSSQMAVNLGYRQPPDDAGVDGPEYDVYIQSLGNGVYGETFAEEEVTETPQNDFRSYIRIDNDFNNGHFTSGVPGAQVTIAHEYLHAIQFGYRTFKTNDEIFYYELSSIWMEDVVYDDVNDYYQYLPGYFQARNSPFNQFTGANLGAAIWNHFLEQKFEDRALLRRPWEIMESGVLAMEAIDRSLRERGSTFADELAEFAVWNYFTGSRADAINFYEEGSAYPEVTLNGDFDLTSEISVKDSSRASTFRYYKFTTLTSGGIVITGSAENSENWRFAAIVTQPGNTVDFHVFNILEGRNLGIIPASSEIVVVPVNALVVDGNDLPQLGRIFFNFSFKIQSIPDTATFVPEVFALHQNFPNPFNLATMLQFDLPIDSKVTVEIFNILGQRVRQLLDDSDLPAGKHNVRWDGRDHADRRLASGVYVVRMHAAEFVSDRKVMLLK